MLAALAWRIMHPLPLTIYPLGDLNLYAVTRNITGDITGTGHREYPPARPAAVALPTTVPVTTASRNITTAGRRLLHPLLLRCPPQSPPPVATSPAAASAVHCGCPAPQAARGEGRVSAHSATQVQEAGGRGGCGKDHRGYAGGALLTWDSANSAIGGGCSASQSFFSHLGKRRLRLAPRLPRLLKAVHVLQVRVLPLTCASVASASRRACPAWLRLFCRSRRCRFSCSCMRVVSSTFWRCSSPT